MVSARFLLVLLLSGAVPAFAADDPDAEWVGRARDIMNNPGEHADTAIIDASVEAERLARERWGSEILGIAKGGEAVIDTAMRTAPEANIAAEHARQSGADMSGYRYRVLVSQAMPAAELRALAELSRERGDLALLVRGLAPGQTFGDIQRWVFDLSSPITEGGKTPAVLIDPRPFAELGVTHAPVLIAYDESEAVLAHVAGITNPGWLDEQVAAGRTGKLPVSGPVVEVIESDMAEMIRAELAKQGDEALRERMRAAAARFWQRADMLDLPNAKESRVRLVDPSFEVTQTITTPDGAVLAVAGERINPLERLQFRQRLIVFDATQPAHVRWAKAELAKDWTIQTSLITARVDRERGWDGYSELIVDFGRPVYFLPSAMRDTYHIQALPTVVTADGGHFVVREVGADDVMEVADAVPAPKDR